MSDLARRFVIVPVYNEEANLAALLDALLVEDGLDAVVAVDDRSSDDSPRILERYAERFSKVRVVTAPERSGQLAAWRTAAALATDGSTLCFVDADSLPQPGAITKLFRTVECDADVVLASGRVAADRVSARWAAARFRAEALHRLRALGRVRDSTIGRFFAARRDWFLAAAVRSDIIANDAFLACRAARSGFVARYVPSAICAYSEASNAFDFAAQRQRADAGYAQLRAMGLLLPEDEPRFVDYLRALGAAGVRDPSGFASWVAEQVRAKTLRAYRAVGKNDGIWEVQASTKRSLKAEPADPSND